jgi:hypothetical protein
VRNFIAALLVVTLNACTDYADVFPLNEAARRIGTPRLTFTRQGDRGPVTISMPDGETLTGTYRVNRSGFVGLAFSGTRSATAIGMGGGTVQFVANGPRTQMLCRGDGGGFGHGSGECESTTGARWAVSW